MSEPSVPRNESDPAAEPGGFVLFLVCAALVAIFLVGVVRMRPPAARGTDAPDAAFSSMRARAELSALLGDSAPRPVGSAANHAFVERLVARFGALGVDAQTERHWIVVPSLQRAAWVENVVARIPGREPGPAIVLLAHHDSVPAGPGASDDGSGVAVLVETARALRAGPPLRRDVVLVVTDGEEAGLLGARAHVRAHGVDDVLAVVNVEARGTSGPSLMFETGPGTAVTVPAWARLAPRPVTSSLFAAIYRRMPNDTDLSVFLREGVPGLNFAFTGDVRHYHTPLDTLANLDGGSLQQHGDNALAAVRGLADADASVNISQDAGEIVWFDVLGFGVARWPQGVPPLLAGLGLLGVLIAIARSVAAGASRIAGVMVSCIVAVLTIAMSLAFAWGLGELLARTGAVPGSFVAAPEGSLAVAAGVSPLAARLADLLLQRWFSPASAACGAWLFFAAVGLVLSLFFPAGCFLFVVPALVAGVLGAVLPPTRGGISAFAGLAAGAVIWFPLVGPLADNLGVRPLVVAAIPFALAAPLLVPFVMAGGRRRGLVAVAGLVLVGGGALRAATADVWTAEQPRPVTVVWSRDADDHHAHWFVACEGDVPAEMRAAAEFDEEPQRVVPWSSGKSLAAEAPAVDLDAPVLADLSVQLRDAGRRVRFRLTSPRGAPITTLVLAPTARIRAISIGGFSVPPESLRRGGTGAVHIDCLTTPTDGLLIELDFADQAPVTAYVADRSSGLPEGADALARARPSGCVPLQSGDATVVHRKLSL